MHLRFGVGVVALAVLTSAVNSSEWDDWIDKRIAAYKAIKEPKQVAFPEMAARLETLFRSHRLSQVRVSTEIDGKRSTTTDIYYGEGQLHVVQHIKGWNLVTKGADVYEWKVGSKTGQVAAIEPKELVEYTIYLTDPAFFPTYLHHLYLTKPELFEAPCPGESGCLELRLKETHESFQAIHIDEKSLWYGAIEFKRQKSGATKKIIFSKPKAIDQIPDEIIKRVDEIEFRESTESLSRHRTYL